MNAHRPFGIRQLIPRRASTSRSPLRNDLWTSVTSIIAVFLSQREPIRMASIGASRDARQAG